jgi:hypothetical protein
MIDRDFGVVVDTFLDDFSISAKSSQGELTSCRETSTDACCAGPCGSKGKPKPSPKPKIASAVGARTRAALRHEVERAIRIKTK